VEEAVAKDLNEVSSSEVLVDEVTWVQPAATETPGWRRRGASSDRGAIQSAGDSTVD
jgi:hypothetical protein